MDSYLERFKQRIQRPEDVLDAADILSELARDRLTITAALANVLQKIRDSDNYPSEVTANQIVLSPYEASSLYDVALSYSRKPAHSIVTSYIYGLICPLNAELQVEHY